MADATLPVIKNTGLDPVTATPVIMVDESGAAVGVSAGGGGGDASAANQTSQITQETAINTVLGVKGDAKSTATDTTAITAMSVWKQISASIQTLAGAISASKAAVTIANGDDATLGAKADAKNTATDTTAISVMSVLKQISASVQTFVFGAGTATAAQRTTLASDDPAVASLSVMDDWDESDRAKVNIIVGQAGVAAGAGAVSATVQRMTLASDDPVTAVAGSISGSAVVTDANGTLQQYLRGLVKQGINFVAGEYETVAVSQTTQTMGATGAAGDYLEAVLIVPSSTAPGAVQIKDGANSAITIFAGGTGSITDLAPIYVPLGLVSTNGAWQITTGSNETAIGIGNFT